MVDKLKAYFVERASKAGKAGTGKAKVRGDKAYYQRISKQAVAARKAKRAK
jgi:hypothetical protein